MSTTEYTPDSLSHDYAVKKARERNCTIEYADDQTLQLDLDSKEAIATFQSQLRMLKELNIINYMESNFRLDLSRSGNLHVTIKLTRPLDVQLRIMLQALLGSDLKREMLSLARVVRGQPHPILLFRPALDTVVF